MPTVDASGRIQASKVSRGEQNDIWLALQEKGATIQSVAGIFGRHIDTVATIQRKFRSTTALASARIRAKALDLVDKVIEKGEVDQIIDVLSRPNIGVLDPVNKGGTSGGLNGGIHVSVGIGSLAAVSVEATPNAPISLPEASIDGEIVKVGPTVMGESSVQRPSRAVRLPGT